MAFHLGKPILVMSLLGVAAGVIGFVSIKRSDRADIELWTFAESHWRAFSGVGLKEGQPFPKRDFEIETGKTVAIKLVQGRALNTRLSMQFMGDIKGEEVPDLVEVEISNVGRFFRPPVSQVGFLPLNNLIKSHGWEGKIVESRLAPWSKGGTIFGIPNDVHPVMICYNAELFERAGVDLAASTSWADFWQKCLDYQSYWRARGVARRWAFEMNESSSDTLYTLLLQRGVNIVDEQDNVRLNEPKVLDTLIQYVRMLEGDRRIGATMASGNQAYAQDLESGYVGALLCPDWRLKYVRDYAPGMAGKLKVMPMPNWPDSPFRTSTWGGTMLAIPRNARDPELSWKFLERIYLREEGLRTTLYGTYILPPVKTVWNDPIMEQKDEYYSGQQVRAMIRDLADEVPPRYVTPASTIAQAELSMVLIKALAFYRSHGDAGIENYCRDLLREAAESVSARIAHGKLEDVETNESPGGSDETP